MQSDLLSSVRGPDNGYLGRISNLSEKLSDVQISFRPSSSVTPDRMRIFTLGEKRKSLMQACLKAKAFRTSKGLLKTTIVMNLSCVILGHMAFIPRKANKSITGQKHVGGGGMFWTLQNPEFQEMVLRSKATARFINPVFEPFRSSDSPINTSGLFVSLNEKQPGLSCGHQDGPQGRKAGGPGPPGVASLGADSPLLWLPGGT